MFYKIQQKIKLDQSVRFVGHSLPRLEMSSYTLLTKEVDNSNPYNNNHNPYSDTETHKKCIS